MWEHVPYHTEPHRDQRLTLVASGPSHNPAGNNRGKSRFVVIFCVSGDSYVNLVLILMAITTTTININRNLVTAITVGLFPIQVGCVLYDTE